MLHDQRRLDTRMGRRDHNNSDELLITVSGEQGTGKTAVLRILIDALADAGLLTVADTKFATEAPNQFFGYSRLDNEARFESIEISVCRDAVVEYHMGRPE